MFTNLQFPIIVWVQHCRYLILTCLLGCHGKYESSKQPKMPEYYQSKKQTFQGQNYVPWNQQKNTPPFSLWCAKQEIDTSVESNAHEGKTWERKQGK